MLKEKHFNKKKEGEFYIQVLAENLKNIRDHFDISQEELAEAAQISVNEVSKIGTQDYKPGSCHPRSIGKRTRVGYRHPAYS